MNKTINNMMLMGQLQNRDKFSDTDLDDLEWPWSA